MNLINYVKSALLVVLLCISVFALAAEQESKSIQPQSNLLNMQINSLTGKTITNMQGEKLGQVNKIVRDTRNNSLQAVIPVGGFLGIGAKIITVPVNELALEQGNLVWKQNVSKDQLKQRTAYQEQEYRDVDSNQTLAQASSPTGVSFQALDTNHDGYVSPDEAKMDPKLSENFNKADTNADHQIEQSEFSAFEEMQSGTNKDTGGSMQQQTQPGSGGM